MGRESPRPDGVANPAATASSNRGCSITCRESLASPRAGRGFLVIASIAFMALDRLAFASEALKAASA